MKRILFIFGLISFLSLAPSFAQQSQSGEEAGADSAEAFAIIPNLEAEETADLDISRIRVIFKTNVKACRIYLNGNFQGVSKLTLNNLIEGFYLLRVEKDGYKSQENFIYAERGKEKSFYIELEPNEETQKKLDAQASAASSQTNAELETQNEEAAFGDAQ